MRRSLVLGLLAASAFALAGPISADAKDNSAHHSEIVVTKHTDAASPSLYKATAKGTHYKKASITVKKTNNGATSVNKLRVDGEANDKDHR